LAALRPGIGGRELGRYRGGRGPAGAAGRDRDHTRDLHDDLHGGDRDHTLDARNTLDARKPTRGRVASDRALAACLPFDHTGRRLTTLWGIVVVVVS
jgi:hypothetical protein